MNSEREYYKGIGEQIKMIRAAYMLSQEDLAYMLGISRIALGMIELGKQKIPLHVFAMLSNVFEYGVNLQLYEPMHTNAELLERKSKLAVEKLEQRLGVSSSIVKSEVK